MMKKAINAVIVSFVVLAMASCGNSNQVGEASPPAQTPEAVVASQNAAQDSDSKADADKQETGTANPEGTVSDQVNSKDTAGDPAESADSNGDIKGSDEDFQNPTMNFVGPYVADSAEMEVSASGKSDAEFKVSWGEEDSAVSVWTMSGELDADTFTVEYENCEKKNYEYNEDGSVASETAVYDDGTGRIIFNPQDGTLVWEDEKEHVADALIFEYNYSVSEAAETGELG